VKVAIRFRGHRRFLSTLVLVVLAIGTLAAPNAAAQDETPAPQPAPPTLPTPPLRPLVHDVLPEPMRGTAALAALDRSVLPAVAAQNGRSVDALTDVLRIDSTAWLDPDGRLFYADAAPPTARAVEPAPPAALPDSQTFRLHSRPGSNWVLHLDFDGFTVPAGSWWQAAGYTALPFDTMEPGRVPRREQHRRRPRCRRE
jgi:hypothetical protein